MNVELLRKIAQVIQEKPAEFDMRHWHSYGEGDNQRTTGKLSSVPKACGATHCIAGWAQVLTPGADPHEYAMDIAPVLLGITKQQGDRLFLADEWPEEFQGEREDEIGDFMPTPEEAAARIEHFIATEGRE